MSSNFLTSFSICHQMLRFKLEHRFLFRKLALNGGWPHSLILCASAPPLSYLLHCLTLIFFSFLISLSLQTLHSFSFSSLLPIYIHHLFYFTVHCCFHSFTTDSSLLVSPPRKRLSSFSKSVVKWACQWRCVLEEGKQRKYSVFFPISYFPLFNNLSTNC